MTRKKIAFVPFCFTYNTLLQTNEVYILVTRRPLRRPVVRKKSENIDPKHTYKKLSKQMNTFKIMESEKDDKGDMHNNIVFFLCFFSYVPFIAKLVLQAVLHLTHLIIFFF